MKVALNEDASRNLSNRKEKKVFEEIVIIYRGSDYEKELERNGLYSVRA